MKRFLFFCLLMLNYLVSNSQLIPQTLGAPTTSVTVKGNLNADSVLGMPKRRPSPTRSKDTGSVYYRVSDSTILKWTGNAWRNIVGARQLNDSTVIIGNDTITIRGTSGGGGGTPGGSNMQIQYNGTGSFAGDPKLSYNSTTKKLTADSVDHIQSRADSTFLRNQAKYQKPDTLGVHGDSHTYGLSASVPDSSYVSRVALGLDAFLINTAVSGTGATSILNRFLIAKSPGNTWAAILMAGFNDIRRNGLPTKTSRKIIHCYKGSFVGQYGKVFIQAGTGGVGVTRNGSWVGSWNAQAEGGKTTVGAYTSSTSDYIEYVSANADTTVFVMLMGGDGSGGSYIGTDIDVYIDGVYVETINTNDQTDGVADGSGLDNKRVSMSFIYTGLSNAVHTIRLVKKATGGGGYMIVDCFGHLVDRTQAQLMLWYHNLHMNATGYAISPANATTPLIDLLNSRIDSLKATYPISIYPTYVDHINDVYNPATDGDADSIHMANAGHRKGADHTLNVTLNSIVPAPAADGAIYYDNEYKGVVNGLKETFLMRRAADSRYIRNQSYFTQTADYKISGTGTAERFVTSGSIFTGTLTSADRQTNGIVGGMASGGPVLSIRNNIGGATNAKTYDVFVGSNGIEWRALSDNLAVAPFYLRVMLTPTPVIDTIQMPKLDITGDLKVYGTARVADDAYDATTWNGNLTVPTKNAIRDKIEAMSAGGITSINSQTGSSQTISGGAGISVGSSSNIHTIGLNTTLDAQVSDANNTGTSATDLFSKTIAANQFTLNGQSIHFEAAGINNDATATVNLEALFAGNGIAGTGAVTISGTGAWSIQGTIIRATSTTARVYTVVTIDNCTQKVFSTTANLTGLDWTATNILKIQATAGGAGGGSNDITAQMWKVVFQP